MSQSNIGWLSQSACLRLKSVEQPDCPHEQKVKSQSRLRFVRWLYRGLGGTRGADFSALSFGLAILLLLHMQCPHWYVSSGMRRENIISRINLFMLATHFPRIPIYPEAKHPILPPSPSGQ
jgi:hypothetical protein